mgnify:CR=1 FL=1
MIQWRDEGILLSVRKHAENSVIAEIFTESHGRHSGVVRGGVGRKRSPILQICLLYTSPSPRDRG